MMSLARFPGVFLVGACLAMVGCAMTPSGERARVMDMPFAAAYSDIAFTVTSAARTSLSCAGLVDCPSEGGRAAALRFSRQALRVAALLERGAQGLYPDLARRLPARHFEVYVVAVDAPGSASCANGRVALNAGLAMGQPDDDWLAFVIAREMGHVIARHHEENSTAVIATSLIFNLVVPGGGLLKSLVSAGSSSLAATSRRDVQAMEADAIAFRLLAAAGFRLRDVSRSLLKAPLALDDGAWSQRFRASSGNLAAEVRRTEFAVASLKRRRIDGPPKRLALY